MWIALTMNDGVVELPWRWKVCKCLYVCFNVVHYVLDLTSSYPVWGQLGPAYKAPDFQSGPGKKRVLHSDWLLRWEAVTEERRWSWENASLGYSSSPAGHWPLAWAGSLSSELNYYWLLGQPGSWRQRGETLGAEWLSVQPSFSSFSLTFGVLEAEFLLPKAASYGQA